MQVEKSEPGNTPANEEASVPSTPEPAKAAPSPEPGKATPRPEPAKAAQRPQPAKAAQRPGPARRAAAPKRATPRPAAKAAAKPAAKSAPARRPAKPAEPQVKPDPAGFVEAAIRAYQDFLDKLEAAWNPLDLRQSAHEAEIELQQALARFDAPHQELERCEARTAYLRAVRSLASTERQSAQIAFAFSRYLDAVRALWSRPDLDSIDPRLISALGESVAWAGYYASQRPDA